MSLKIKVATVPKKEEIPSKKKVKNTVLEAKDYQRLSQKQHIYQISDTYVGSDEKVSHEDWVLDVETNHMIKKKIDTPQAVKRLFLEIISNSADNADRSNRAGVDAGTIEVKMDKNSISIRNGGAPIPVEIHDKEKIYVPEMIFGTLLTSSNYDKDTIRMGCGRNGYGAKLVNIFSKEFIIKVGDPIRKLSYEQKWTNNMDIRGEPKIASYSGPSFVEVSYKMDFERFGYSTETGYPIEVFELFSRYAADFSFTCKVPVTFNEKQINVQDIKTYASLYFGPVGKEINYLTHSEWTKGVEMVEKKGNKVPKNPNEPPMIELCLIDTPDNANIISFVNGMMTPEGGVHVESIYKAISGTLLETVNGGKKKPSAQKEDTKVKLTLADIRPHISMIVNCRLPDPKFTSQSKTVLSSPTPKIDVDEKSLAKILKWSLIERLYATLEAKQFKTLTKTDGKKRKHISLDKGEDANEAGGPRSQNCTLYVVEGKSAMGYAVKAISLVPSGRNTIGVLPLQGKPLNAMNATPQQIAEHQGFVELKKMLGLREGVDYSIEENFKTLRYGYMVILADSDDDGKHIIGLILNLFHCRYQSLLARGFIMYLRTPILRVFKGNQAEKFYVSRDYEKWKRQTADWSSWRHKYYKGLGTSKDSDIEDDFKSPRVVICLYDDKAKDSLVLAFDDKLADARKKWIAEYKEVLELEDLKMQPISQFMNSEFIQFSVANLRRSIPKLLDGLKLSQRKVLWASFKQWASKGEEIIVKNPVEMKVARFSAYTAQQTNYHHGEKCLDDTIVTMAQDFTGSNNMPYLRRDGQFGTRNMGGQDASASRYIETRPEKWINYVYRKEDLDLLTMITDDGEEVEPEFLLPILPMQLINGCNGIGTGHSTFIPNYNPLDICKWLKARLKEEATFSLTPWFKDFSGTIEIVGKSKGKEIEEETEAEPVRDEEDPDFVGNDPKGTTLLTKGTYEVKADGKVIVTELPVGRWINKYHKWLESLVETKEISDFRNLSTHDKVFFEISGFHLPNSVKLRLRKSYGLTNMVLLDKEQKPVKFGSATDIIEAFYIERLPYYELRRQNIIKKINMEKKKAVEKITFIKNVISGKLEIFGKKKQEIMIQMEKLSLPYELVNNVRMTNCTEEEIKDLENDIIELTKNLEIAEKTTSKQLWLKDLDSFEEFYKTCK